MAQFKQLSVLLVLLATTTLIAGDDGWTQGRATYYGLDGWSIHKGSCGFGYIYPDQYPGFDVVAIADASSEFAGSCGRCYEVRCRDADFTDGYGEQLKRSNGACRDSSKSLVVRATDNCPCEYPGNAYSNKRWCCGDSGSGGAHMDMSIWAFEKLASSLGLGAIGIEYRRVACDYVPSNQAPAIANPSPAEQPWPGAKRPEDMLLVRRFDSVGGPQDAVAQIDSPSQANGQPLVPVSQLFQGADVEAILDGKVEQEATTGTSSSSSSGSSDCYDKSPSNGNSCQQEKDWGNCDEDWLVSEGACRQTCGKCSTSSSGSSSSAPSDGSGCDDKQPTDGSSCESQKNNGNCDEDWMNSGGFCKASCGKCSVQSFDGGN